MAQLSLKTIKALAEVYKIPVAEITSLESLAMSTSKNETIVALIDARNNQVYSGIFDEKIKLKEEYIADDINIVLEKVANYENIIFVGNGAILHQELINEKIKNAKFSENNDQNSFFVGLVGFEKFKNNELKDADTIMPIYLRKR